MNKLESTIPFDGFYNSYISSDIEHQIGQQIEWDADIYDLNEDEQQILFDNYLSAVSYTHLTLPTIYSV